MQTEENTEKTNPKMKIAVIFGLAIVITAISAATIFLAKRNWDTSVSTEKYQNEKKVFEENFREEEVLYETAKMSDSKDQDWWLNSGGLATFGDGIGKTAQGELATYSEWYKKYKKNNPEDTDEGLHPQNIFRLVTRSQWTNLKQEVYFQINKMNFSESENRNESNGILLFNRYEDGDNLYYTGLRVDGHAVIKKKYGGKYYTLQEKKFFPGDAYNRETNPNLLPLGEWIGLRSELRNIPNGDVDIRLYVDVGKTGNWTLAANVTDDGRKEFGKNILSDAGHAGIRTDFMDVEFASFKISEID